MHCHDLEIPLIFRFYFRPMMQFRVLLRPSMIRVFLQPHMHDLRTALVVSMMPTFSMYNPLIFFLSCRIDAKDKPLRVRLMILLALAALQLIAAFNRQLLPWRCILKCWNTHPILHITLAGKTRSQIMSVAALNVLAKASPTKYCNPKRCQIL